MEHNEIGFSTCNVLRFINQFNIEQPDYYGEECFLAMLEYEWLDIELCMKTNSQDLCYYCHRRGLNEDGVKDWEGYDFIDGDVDIDFSADNWRELLKADMKQKLAEFAERRGLRYDKPNWDYRKVGSYERS